MILKKPVTPLRGLSGMKCKTLVLCLLATGTALGAASFAPADAAAETLTLKNGMRVILTPDPQATAADVALWFPAGARVEREGQSGLAHVAERVVARLGVQAGEGRWMKQVADAGGTPGSASTYDYTSFYETVPGERLGAALRIEAARLAAAPTDAGLFEGERRRAREDLSRAQRTPVARGLQRLSATLYAGDPYARSLFGTDRDLAALTARDVDGWRRERFAAGSAVLTVTGRFDAPSTLALIRELFESLPRGTAAAAAAPLKPAGAGERESAEHTESPARVLFAGWRSPGASDPDAPALALLTQVLAGAGSPLEKSLVQDWKSAALVQAGLDERRQSSTLWTLAVLRADADTSTARRAMIDVVKGLAREPLAGEVFDRAMRTLETNEALRLQGARARAQALGQDAIMSSAAGAAAGAATEAARLQALRALTPADLQRVAARISTDAGLATFWLLPQATEGGR
jgi:zinc protease